MRSPEPVILTPAMPLRTRLPANERWTLFRLCIASPLLLMTGPASSGGGADCCPGSTELMAPLFHTRRQETMATPIVMSRAIEHATKRPIHPCREKAGPPEGGVGVGSEEGAGKRLARRG